MDWVVFVLALAVSGLIVGGLARLLVPGPEDMGLFATILAGLAGSFLGGFVGRALFGRTGWLGSLLLAVGAAVLLVLPFSLRRRRVY
ncbi:MAG: GlsB/YeaQ/YmgE family stress response membrane protein [Actinomycetota bacterium]|nr:GlsB/YeaQ/YmgE family stress response membrane protein [Actinomycetota bacterium]